MHLIGEGHVIGEGHLLHGNFMLQVNFHKDLVGGLLHNLSIYLIHKYSIIYLLLLSHLQKLHAVLFDKVLVLTRPSSRTGTLLYQVMYRHGGC